MLKFVLQNIYFIILQQIVILILYFYIIYFSFKELCKFGVIRSLKCFKHTYCLTNLNPLHVVKENDSLLLDCKCQACLHLFFAHAIQLFYVYFKLLNFLNPSTFSSLLPQLRLLAKLCRDPYSQDRDP